MFHSALQQQLAPKSVKPVSAHRHKVYKAHHTKSDLDLAAQIKLGPLVTKTTTRMIFVTDKQGNDVYLQLKNTGNYSVHHFFGIAPNSLLTKTGEYDLKLTISPEMVAEIKPERNHNPVKSLNLFEV